MRSCICCGGEEETYSFQVLEVRTLYLRELQGERRIQGLGELRRCVVCRGCAQDYLEGVLRPWGFLLRQGSPFAAVLLLGALLLGVLRPGERPFQILGAAAVICGTVGVISAIRTAFRRRRTYWGLPQEAALKCAAWDCTLSALPRKAEDADVTYIPLNRETAAMESEELAQRFNLLAPIAREAAKWMAEAR